MPSWPRCWPGPLTLSRWSRPTVGQEGQTITIEPSDLEIIYVPAYDPWAMYGDPMVAWPGWYPYPGIWFGGPMQEIHFTTFCDR